MKEIRCDGEIPVVDMGWEAREEEWWAKRR